MDFYYEWIGYTKSIKWTGHLKRMKIWNPKWMDIEQVHKVDGSSQEDENLKSKMDGYKTSPQSGRIIPRGWKFKVQNDQVHKVDGSSQEDENLKSKMDRSSQEDENLKSKMDGYKTSPQNGWIIPRGWKFEVQNEQVLKVDGSSQEDENLKSKMDGYKTSPQNGQITPRGWKFEVQNGWIQNKSTKWTDHPKRMKIWSPKWTDIEQVHKVDGSSQEDENLKSKIDRYCTIPQSGRVVPEGRIILLVRWTNKHPQTRRIWRKRNPIRRRIQTRSTIAEFKYKIKNPEIKTLS